MIFAVFVKFFNKMSEVSVSTRRSKGSGRFGAEQKLLKEAGKAYKTRKRKDVAEKALPCQQVC